MNPYVYQRRSKFASSQTPSLGRSVWSFVKGIASGPVSGLTAFAFIAFAVVSTGAITLIANSEMNGADLYAPVTGLFSSLKPHSQVLGAATYGYNQPVCDNGYCLSYELLGNNGSNWFAKINYTFPKSVRAGALRENGRVIAYNLSGSNSVYTDYSLNPNTDYTFQLLASRTSTYVRQALVLTSTTISSGGEPSYGYNIPSKVFQPSAYGTNPLSNIRYVAAGQTHMPLFSFRVFAGNQQPLYIQGFRFQINTFPDGKSVDGLVNNFVVQQVDNTSVQTTLSTGLSNMLAEATFGGNSVVVPQGESREFVLYGDINGSLPTEQLAATLKWITNSGNVAIGGVGSINGVIQVSNTQQSVTISTSGSFHGTVGQSFNAFVNFSSVLPFSIVASSTLPSGLTGQSNGVSYSIIGTPTQSGISTGGIAAVDKNGNVLASQQFTITIDPVATTTGVRVGQLVSINNTVYLVGKTGLYGFPSLAVFNSWGYTFTQVGTPNAAEQALTQVGVVPTKIDGCSSPLDQIAGTCGTGSTAVAPKISGVQGYDSTTGQYTNNIVTAGKYLIVYGSFPSGQLNSILVGPNNQTVSTSITYQSATQINIKVGDISGSCTSTMCATIAITGTPDSFGKALSSQVGLYVSAGSATTATTPVITGVQGYDASTGAYTSRISANKYVILYGSFLASGNTVSVNGQTYTPTYQSTSQINMLLGAASGTTASILITNGSATSNTYSVGITGPTSTTPPQATAPKINGAQGYDSVTGSYVSTINSGKYLLLYGAFTADGNSVTVNGQSMTVTYQSVSQINVQLGTLTGSSASVIVTNSAGSSNAYTVSVATAPTQALTAPIISGAQGYDPTTGAYGSNITANKYLIVYGTFAASGNTVSVNGQSYTPTYQSTSQINVLLGSLTGTTAAIMVTNSNGTSSSYSVTIVASGGSSQAGVAPVISGVQGYDASTGAYTSSISSNKYLILYGTFAASGNTVNVNGQAYTPTYQSVSQLNVQLGTLSGTSATVTVANSAGTSSGYNISVVAPSANTTPTASAPVISGVQGYDASTGAYTSTVTSSKYMIVYGSFASSGNTITVNGQSMTATYQSTSQINVQLGTLSGTTASIAVTNAGGTSSSYSATVSAATSQAPAAAKPIISGAQGYDASTGAYTATISSNKFAILYGTFDSTGNSVSVNGQSLTPTYQSTSQLNVQLGTISGTTAALVVTSNGGASNTFTVSVAAGTTSGSNPASSVSVINGMQGYDGSYNAYISAGKYLILYGTFAGTGDAVTVNGSTQTVTYDSASQINVQLGSLTGSTASVVVSNTSGSSGASTILVH